MRKTVSHDSKELIGLKEILQWRVFSILNTSICSGRCTLLSVFCVLCITFSIKKFPWLKNKNERKKLLKREVIQQYESEIKNKQDNIQEEDIKYSARHHI